MFWKHTDLQSIVCYNFAIVHKNIHGRETAHISSVVFIIPS